MLCSQIFLGYMWNNTNFILHILTNIGGGVWDISILIREGRAETSSQKS